jgi:YaiO family outer membrane protein
MNARRRPRWASRGVLLASLAAAPLAAQGGEPAARWSATLHYDAQHVPPGPEGAYWHTLTAGVGRRTAAGSLSLQAVAIRRFEIDERAFVADVYPKLWRGAYGNVRVGVAPGAKTTSRYDVGAEVFQGVGSSELSASLRRQGFEAAEVSAVGVGLGHYIGNWYLRPRTVVARVDRSWAPFVAFTGRRYLRDRTDHSVDLTVGMGEEVLEVAAPAGGDGRLDVVTAGSRFAAVRSQLFFRRHVGATAGASYSAYEAIPDRWGVSLGVLTRW